jgi:hypothetical protein
MRSLADHAPAAADATGDFLAAQFVARRLPPRPTVLQSPPSHRKLALRWVDPTAVRVVVESRPGQEAEIQIYHTMENVASSHMHPDLETWKRFRMVIVFLWADSCCGNVRSKEPQPACIVLEGMEYLPALQASPPASVVVSETVGVAFGMAIVTIVRWLWPGPESCQWCMGTGIISGFS